MKKLTKRRMSSCMFSLVVVMICVLCMLVLMVPIVLCEDISTKLKVLFTVFSVVVAIMIVLGFYVMYKVRKMLTRHEANMEEKDADM